MLNCLKLATIFLCDSDRGKDSQSMPSDMGRQSLWAAIVHMHHRYLLLLQMGDSVEQLANPRSPE